MTLRLWKERIMNKSDSGIVAILANYNTPGMRKVLDLKITSGYPTVTIPKGFRIHIPELKISSEDYQHITIPPDLNTHVTGNGKPKIWAPKKDELITAQGKLIPEFQKILTVIFPPISDFPVFTDRSYKGALLIAFSQLPHWNEYTSFVLELFAQKASDTIVPTDQHYLGDQGAYMPWEYSDLGKTFNEPHKQGQYWVRQFAITNHSKKDNKTFSIYFWDSARSD